MSFNVFRSFIQYDIFYYLTNYIYEKTSNHSTYLLFIIHRLQG